MRTVFPAGLSALLLISVFAGLPTYSSGMESKEESMMGAAPRRAELAGAAGHHASGTAALAKDGAGKFSLTFSNLDVDRVPDGRVYLAQHGDYTKGIEVGKLTVFQGVVTFMIPKEANPDEYDGVVIWCKKFGVEIGHGTFMGNY